MQIHKPKMGKLALLILLLLLIPCSCIRPDDTNSTRCIEEERQALLTFKHSFGGPYIQRLRSWQGHDCCGWDGVSCDKSTGRVLKLDVRAPERALKLLHMQPPPMFQKNNHKFYTDQWDQLEAKEVNPSLMKLKYLTYLDLSGNNFQWSSIPQFLGQMKGLTYLNLSWTSLGGVVPRHLGNLSGLEFLDLSGNGRGLYVDDLRWVSSLSSLQHLDMGGLDLRQVAPNLVQQVLTHLPSLLHLGLGHCEFNNTHFLSDPSANSTFLRPTLRYLDLSSNNLDGPIPDFIQKIASLEVLDLSFNFFNSSVPLWLGNLKNLESLRLPVNALNSPNGEIWSILRNLSNLHLLDLSYNQFNGIVPASLGRLVSLRSLDLSFNQFNGIIPASFGRLISLSLLDLSRNQFNGIIPTFERLVSLSSLDLSNNQFTGIIPTFERLVSLSLLDLSNNQFTGIIPPSIGILKTLTYLDLSDNELNGTIPSSLGKLSNLMGLDLSNNRLNGVIPKSLGQLVNLTRLFLDSNALEGVVYTKYHFANLSSLESLTMGNNHHIKLQVEPNWVPPFQLDYIELSSCKFEPRQFPTWLRTQNQMRELDLSNTSISDTFPLWLLDKPSLATLDLSHNQIKGPLPSHIENAPSELIMSDNMLNGSIPTWLCNVGMYGSLDLSKNMFSGHIPNCLMNNQALQVIDLSSNNLSGIIPSSFQNMSSLVWLLLSNNSLNGPVPPGLRNLNLLALDLGGNRLSGSLPAWIGESIPSLRILNMRNNNFNGIIPRELCLLSRLQIMDLADNDLEGTLPNCLGNLTFMTVLQSIYTPSTLNSIQKWDKSNIRQVLKGRELEYTSVLKYLVNMDLSGNRLYGSIPQELTQLSGLIGLNLARNQLSGSIPEKIGDLMSLESLDLSQNQLSGEIPNSLAALTSLSYLNLSSNNLKGKIPPGNQLQTLDDPSIYQGNPNLCGPPLPQSCPENNLTRNGYGGEDKNEDKDNALENMWVYIVAMAGYATGFWAVMGVLLLKKSWRHAYFTYADETKDKVYVAVVVKIGAFKKKMKKMKASQPQ